MVYIYLCTEKNLLIILSATKYARKHHQTQHLCLWREKGRRQEQHLANTIKSDQWKGRKVCNMLMQKHCTVTIYPKSNQIENCI